jgi:hypothetical protein
MTYDFRNLSYLDFEDLARDLIGRELGMRFEAFCAGPDGGIDGRNAAAKSNLSLLQAKHYAGSAFCDLKSAMKRARPAINKLKPMRYILATSCGFTPKSKAELAEVIGPTLLGESDIFGPEDLEHIGSSFDHLVGASEQNRRHFQPYRLGRLQVDHQFELRRLLDSQLARIRPFKNLVDICCKPLE